MGLFAFLLVIVITPIQQIWSFFGYICLLVILITLAQIPAVIVLKRLVIEIPFVFFAILMPFLAGGDRREILGVSVSTEGLTSAASILIKATCGVVIAIILSSTTTAAQILRGLEILKMPDLIVQIASFMLRYLNVINDEMARMNIARSSRGFDARGIKDWKILANAAGALFIRSYERGERVHVSMLSRGYQGSLSVHAKEIVTRRDFVLLGLIIITALLFFTLGKVVQ